MLRIGLVSRAGESGALRALLAERGVEIAVERSPENLGEADIASRAVAVWLVHLGEDDWAENVDRLLDAAVAPVFIDEPETLAGHAYPAYWARSLAERLQELAGEPEVPADDGLGVLELPEELDFSLAGLAEDEDLLAVPQPAVASEPEPAEPVTEAPADIEPPAPEASEAIPPELGGLEFGFAVDAADSEETTPQGLEFELAGDEDAPVSPAVIPPATRAQGRIEPEFTLDWDLTPAGGGPEILGIDFGTPPAPLPAEPVPEVHAVSPEGDMTGIEEVELRWSDTPSAADSPLVSDEPAPDELLELDFPTAFDVEPGAGDFAFDLVADELPVHEDAPLPQMAASAPWQLVVLAASLGGPAAVKRFLQALPPGLPAVFVLAQHIDPGFLPVLARALETASPYQVVMVEGSHDLAMGQLVLVPVASRLNFAHGGLVTTSPAHWTPPYAPCINDVMEDVAKMYGEQALCIVFSGMGDDGAEGGKAVLAQGGLVWAQDAESCANSSMPDSARAAGVVSYTGTPEELARHCAEFLGHRDDAAAVNH